MVVSALVASKRFVVTENRDRADATLRGVALENTVRSCMHLTRALSPDAQLSATRQPAQKPQRRLVFPYDSSIRMAMSFGLRPKKAKAQNTKAQAPQRR